MARDRFGERAAQAQLPKPVLISAFPKRWLRSTEDVLLASERALCCGGKFLDRCPAEKTGVEQGVRPAFTLKMGGQRRVGSRHSVELAFVQAEAARSRRCGRGDRHKTGLTIFAGLE